MGYKIAVGSSDGVNVDLKFGEVTRFLIYEVTDEIRLTEERIVTADVADQTQKQEACKDTGCGNGCSGNGSGCSGSSDVLSKVSLIEDCRCVVCKKIGFQAQKQFEKKAISYFDISCTVEEALDKITFYYDRIDNHVSLRNKTD